MLISSCHLIFIASNIKLHGINNLMLFSYLYQGFSSYFWLCRRGGATIAFGPCEPGAFSYARRPFQFVAAPEFQFLE